VTERVSIKEAAERLGVSQDTIRRRLKHGELAGERAKTPQGFVWRVELPQEPAGEAEGTAPESAPAPGDGIELARLRERIAGLERLAKELRSERDAWHEQAQRDGEAAREFRVLLRNEQLGALPAETARQDTPGAAETPPHDVEIITWRTAPAPTRRSLWDRLHRKR